MKRIASRRISKCKGPRGWNRLARPKPGGDQCAWHAVSPGRGIGAGLRGAVGSHGPWGNDRDIMIPGSVGNHRGLLHENNYENSITLMCGEWLAQNSKKRVAGRGGGVLAGPDPSGCDSQEDSHQDRRWVLPVPAEAPLLSHPGLHFILNKKETLTTKLKENENDREKLNSPINIFTKVEKNLIQALYL